MELFGSAWEQNIDVFVQKSCVFVIKIKTTEVKCYSFPNRTTIFEALNSALRHSSGRRESKESVRTIGEFAAALRSNLDPEKTPFMNGKSVKNVRKAC